MSAPDLDKTSPESAPESERPAALSRVRGWLARRRHWLFTTAVVGSGFAASYTSVLQNQALYAPDTRYYAAMALRFGGADKQSAAEQVTRYTDASGWVTPSVDQLFGWGLVQPRVVYPALSVPFVKLFGIDGMAVVPALAMAALVVLLTVTLRARYGWAAALGVVLLVVASPQLMFYGSAMLTESLTAVWCALLLIAVWRYQRSPRPLLIGAMVGLTTVMAFTRQSTLIPAAALAVAWIGAAILRDHPRRWAMPAVTVVATTVVAQVAQTLVFPTFSQLNQFLIKTGTKNLREALMASPRLAWKILNADATFLMHYDHALLILIVLSIVAVCVLWRHSESHLLIGAFLGVTVYNVTNGTPTVFRYAMPGLVFYAIAVGALVSRAAHAERTIGDEAPDVEVRPSRLPDPGTPTAA